MLRQLPGCDSTSSLLPTQVPSPQPEHAGHYFSNVQTDAKTSIVTQASYSLNPFGFLLGSEYMIITIILLRGGVPTLSCFHRNLLSLKHPPTLVKPRAHLPLLQARKPYQINPPRNRLLPSHAPQPWQGLPLWPDPDDLCQLPAKSCKQENHVSSSFIYQSSCSK